MVDKPSWYKKMSLVLDTSLKWYQEKWKSQLYINPATFNIIKYHDRYPQSMGLYY